MHEVITWKNNGHIVENTGNSGITFPLQGQKNTERLIEHSKKNIFSQNIFHDRKQYCFVAVRTQAFVIIIKTIWNSE